MQESLLAIETARLQLIPLPVEAARAATADCAAAEKLLAVRIPEEWPAADLRDFLPVYIQLLEQGAITPGWGIWAILYKAEGVLIGDAGFQGNSDDNGTVELGYSILPAFRRRGFAFEATTALVRWAFDQPGVRRITAECLADNVGSIRILQKLGMRRLEPAGDMLRWELPKP